ncbi:GNAT family N-acetyltransferase [Puniceicoccus vermicola]|uniref:GNAT family N-acetyltransferase n=1 Tax=Puniceicoccus vermicola TaxID=388746 RepID=A0A7X1AX53_9BACT|nr:GNAT family N-acetyltransferase [Puniceicoccus vermicola]MBC2601628.1 GNAT family N-acetyltransferase [Puniceicoccus vermicola]
MIEITEVELNEQPEAVLEAYARITSYFRYSVILDAVIPERGLGDIILRERTIPEKEKNYDAIEPPIQWARSWDLTKWGVFHALVGGEHVGGCLVAYDTEGVHMLEGRSDLSVLWDIRVSSQHRGQGIGSQLFSQALRWSKSRGCKKMKIETQNNNLGACRFYARMGCSLQSINRFHYQDFPEEIQLIWSIEIN